MTEIYIDAKIEYLLQDAETPSFQMRFVDWRDKDIYWQAIRQAQKEGINILRMRLSNKLEAWSDRTSRFFHAMRDKIAEHHAEDKRQTKINLKLAYGVKEEVITGTWILKSITKYTKKEWNTLIEGTQQECFDNGIDIIQEVNEYVQNK
jgi:hypothetical protein